MELYIHFTNDQPKYIQIYQRIRQYILEKQIDAHYKLPSKRNLAQQLNVSILTVQTAYEQLQSEGYIYSIERQGSFVSAFDEAWEYSEKPVVLKEAASRPSAIINFKNGQVDETAFPYKHWLRIYKNELNELGGGTAPWQGEYSLRLQLAHYLSQARGIACQPEQIYIFNGFQQQLLNICLFFSPQIVGMEEPGFIRAKAVFEQMQLDCKPIPVDDEGCMVPRQSLKLLYTTPAHQYPTGKIMTASRRLHLLKWAVEHNSYIIEDDYDSEFRYKGAPISTLSHLDSFDRVLYFGTFSKTLLPSLRISYLVMPATLQADYEKFNRFQKSVVSKVNQRVTARFMEAGNYAKHIAKMRTLYRTKRNCLVESVHNHLGDEFKMIGDAAGLHIIVHLPAGLDESEALARANANGIAIDAVSTMYQQEKPHNQVMIGYGAPSIDEIKAGIKILGEIWR